MLLHLGNTAPIGGDGEQTTTVSFPDGLTVDEAFTAVTHPDGVWAAHSTQPPTWVASPWAELTARLAPHYGCEVRDIDDTEGTA